MKRFTVTCLFLLLSVAALAAQKPVAKTAPAITPVAAQPAPSPTKEAIEITKLQIENAQLVLQLHDLMDQVHLYEAATGIAQRRAQDQRQVDALKQALPAEPDPGASPAPAAAAVPEPKK
jgi:hypothetical protein